MPGLKPLLAITALLFFALGGSASAQSPAAQRPAHKVGDTWTYAIRNSQNPPDSQYTITVNSVGAGQIMASWDNPIRRLSGTFLFDQDLNMVEDKQTSGPVTYRATPAYPGFQWPLYAGETWQRSFQYTTQDAGVQYRATLTAQVVDLEKVTVAAGTFDAYKINRTLGYTAYNGNNSWSGTQNVVIWYAPQVKSFVKSEITDSGPRRFATGTTTRELLSYHVK